MSLRINHNLAAINGHRQMVRNDAAVSKSLERLSSGLRINRAADDAAGLIISEQMRSQIAGTDQAIRNSETAVSFMQTAEAALDEVSTLLTKARGLALHAANEGANDQNQLQADQTELDNIVDSIDRIAQQTQFGTKKLLDGTLSSFRSNSPLVGTTQTGGHYAAGIASGTVTRGYHSILINTEATQGNLFLTGGSADFVPVTTGLRTIDEMIGTDTFQKGFTVSVNGLQIAITSGQTKNDLVSALNSAGKSLGFTSVVVTAAAAGAAYSGAGGNSNSGLGAIALLNQSYGSSASITFSFVAGASGAVDIGSTYTAGTDMDGFLLLNSGAVGSVATTGNQAIALTQSGNSLTLVSSATTGYRISLTSALSITGGANQSGLYLGVIDGMSTGATFQVGANVGQRKSVTIDSAKSSDLGQGASAVFKSFSQLKGNGLMIGQADEVLKVIDRSVDTITVMRGRIGAFQSNTLETNINSLRVAGENLTAAESTIRDADFAYESAQFTKNNILVQSATAMLAQANQLPQNVLKLLNG